MLHCSNRASICSHALILLSQTRWFVTTGCRTSISLQPFDQTRSKCGSLLFTSIVSTLCLKHVWNVYPCLRTRISFQHCVSNTFGLWFRVWVQASASCFLGQTRLVFGSLLCTSIRLHPCVKHDQIKVLCLRTCISPSPLFRMCLDCGSLSVHKHPSSSLVQTRLILVACLLTSPARTEMKVTPELEKILHRARAPNQLSTFLEKEQLFGVDDVALVCTKEGESVHQKSLGLVQGSICNGAPWSTYFPDGAR